MRFSRCCCAVRFRAKVQLSHKIETSASPTATERSPSRGQKGSSQAIIDCFGKLNCLRSKSLQISDFFFEASKLKFLPLFSRRLTFPASEHSVQNNLELILRATVRRQIINSSNSQTISDFLKLINAKQLQKQRNCSRVFICSPTQIFSLLTSQ